MRAVVVVSALLVVVAAVPGCAGVESDLKRAEIREFFLDFVKGKDRGVFEYGRTIETSTMDVQGQRYQYAQPAHISNFLIDRAVRGLGGTKLPNSDYLAYAVDRLFFVMAHDPTAALRSTSCEQLGRILLTLPAPDPAVPPGPAGANAEGQINNISQDLLQLGLDAKKGKRVPVSAVVERMRALAEWDPPTFLSARQMVRALASSPVVGVVGGPVRDTSEEITPGIVRRSILVALREIAVGDAPRLFEPDPAPLVRQSALEVLARVAAPLAREGAITRLAGKIDPPERDPDVRRALVAYLGRVGGPGAFRACVERLDDLDIGVRLHAQEALQAMTGARVAPSADAWRAWAEDQPSWGGRAPVTKGAAR